MNQAIKNHATEHQNKETDHKKARAEAQRIKDQLITQTLTKAAQQSKTQP